MYAYAVGSNFPGCLPDSKPVIFDNEADAREYMRDEFGRIADLHYESGDKEGGKAFDSFVEDMNFHSDAAGQGDSYWDGPDGMIYFIECHDVTDDEWEESQRY